MSSSRERNSRLDRDSKKGHDGRGEKRDSSGSRGKAETNTRIFIGSLYGVGDEYVNPNDLHNLFVTFGDIESTARPKEKPFGFVIMKNRDEAKTAIRQLDGTVFKGNKLRVRLGATHVLKLFVRFPPNTTASDLRNAFDKHGHTVESVIMKQKSPTKGFAFVDIRLVDGFHAVPSIIEKLNGIKVHGKSLFVEKYEEKGPPGGGGPGGNFQGGFNDDRPGREGYMGPGMGQQWGNDGGYMEPNMGPGWNNEGQMMGDMGHMGGNMGPMHGGMGGNMHSMHGDMGPMRGDMGGGYDLRNDIRNMEYPNDGPRGFHDDRVGSNPQRNSRFDMSEPSHSRKRSAERAGHADEQPKKTMRDVGDDRAAKTTDSVTAGLEDFVAELETALDQKVLGARMSGFGVYFETGTFSDVVLQCRDQRFPLHKLALATSSPVFAKMMRNSSTNTIEVNNYAVDAMRLLLKFMYTGKFDGSELNPNLVPDLVTAAMQFKVLGCQQAIELALIKELNTTNAVDLLLYAASREFKDLKSAGIKFIIGHKSILENAEEKTKLKSNPDVMMELFDASTSLM